MNQSMISVAALVFFSLVSASADEFREPAFRWPRERHLDQDRVVVVVGPEMSEVLTEVGSTNWIALHGHVTAGGDLSQSVVGLRIQFIPVRTNDIFIAVEGIYEGRKVGGGEIFDLTHAVGGGLRFQIPTLSDGRDALLISPGVDVIVALGDDQQIWREATIPYSNIYFVGTNLDVSWVRKFARHFAFELGLRLGAEVSLGGLNAQNHQTKGEWFPQVNIFSGVRF